MMMMMMMMTDDDDSDDDEDDDDYLPDEGLEVHPRTCGPDGARQRPDLFRHSGYDPPMRPYLLRVSLFVLSTRAALCQRISVASRTAAFSSSKPSQARAQSSIYEGERTLASAQCWMQISCSKSSLRERALLNV
eukprot:192544-Amphidinium_carterae.1